MTDGRNLRRVRLKRRPPPADVTTWPVVRDISPEEVPGAGSPSFPAEEGKPCSELGKDVPNRRATGKDPQIVLLERENRTRPEVRHGSRDPHGFLTESEEPLGIKMLCAMGQPRSFKNLPGLASIAMAPGRRRRAPVVAAILIATGGLWWRRRVGAPRSAGRPRPLRALGQEHDNDQLDLPVRAGSQMSPTTRPPGRLASSRVGRPPSRRRPSPRFRSRRPSPPTAPRT